MRTIYLIPELDELLPTLVPKLKDTVVEINHGVGAMFALRIVIPPSKLIPPRWMPHEPGTRLTRIRGYGENGCEYTTAQIYDRQLGHVVSDGRPCLAEMEMPVADANTNSIVHCPRCVLKFLADRGEDYAIDFFGYLGRPDQVNERRYFNGVNFPAPLHWGLSGEVGVCYDCAGMPDERPSW